VNCFRALLQSEVASSISNLLLSALVASFLCAQEKDLPIRDHIAVLIDFLRSESLEDGNARWTMGLNILATSLMTLLISILAFEQVVADGISKEESRVSAVLALATASPGAFREALIRIKPDDRETVEILLRRALQEREDSNIRQPMKPSISLRSDFALAE